MNRRQLLGLLGIAATGGAAKLYADENSAQPGAKQRLDGMFDDSVDDSSVDWSDRLQSRLPDQRAYGTASFASESNMVEFEEEGPIPLSKVTAEPAQSGDRIRFDVGDGGAPAIVQTMVQDTLRLASDVSVEAQVGEESVTFTGGRAGSGSFAGALAVHPSEPAVLLVRAEDTDQLVSQIRSPV
jgi:hypothetical protein